MIQAEVKKVYSFVNPAIKSWDLTDDEEFAKQNDTYYSLATLENLNDMACGGYIIEGKILTREGENVEWFEESQEYVYGGLDEYVCEYRVIS